MARTIICWFLSNLLFVWCTRVEGYSRVTLPNCGKSLDVLPRIVGGFPVKDGFLPWMVTLHQKVDVDFHHICGGSVLNHRWIITAAHCIQHPDEPELYEMYVGLHRLSRKSARKVKRHMVSTLIVHEGYSSESMDHDIALVKTADPIDFKGSEGYVNGVCLPAPGQPAHVPGIAVVAGWGHTSEGGEASDVLRKVYVPLRHRKYCNKVYDSEETNVRSKITKNMICAGRVGLDSCQADSGGPLIMWQNGRAYQFGVVSFGDGCGRKGYPGVYTRVSAYVHWIERSVHSH